MSFEESRTIAEGVRLARGYTRAMESLLTYAESRRLFGSGIFNSPSRLSKSYRRMFGRSASRSQWSRLFPCSDQITILKRNKLQNSSVLNNIKRLEITVSHGDRVNHPVFGKAWSSTMRPSHKHACRLTSTTRHQWLYCRLLSWKLFSLLCSGLC